MNINIYINVCNLRKNGRRKHAFNLLMFTVQYLSKGQCVCVCVFVFSRPALYIKIVMEAYLWPSSSLGTRQSCRLTNHQIEMMSVQFVVEMHNLVTEKILF